MRIAIALLLAVIALFSICAVAAPKSKGDDSNAPSAGPSSPPIVRPAQDADAKRVEGEQRFKANCNRCHAAPHKFPPRMMATIVRHMRVRATITDEDMRLILFYMTQ
jgi:mono/diheme cytochrome c family protein